MVGATELETLKNQAAYFEDALKGIRQQIEELQSRTKED
jgi:prefoldin subunit 5